MSLPDDLFEQAERYDARTRKSRSHVVADAIREYLASHDADSPTAALDRVSAESDVKEDQFVGCAAARILQRSDCLRTRFRRPVVLVQGNAFNRSRIGTAGASNRCAILTAYGVFVVVDFVRRDRRRMGQLILRRGAL